MKSLLKEEFRRAFCGRGMMLSLIIGCIVAFSHVLLYQIPQSAANLELDFGLDPMYLPETIYDGWLAGNGYTPQSLIYFLILPILAALPFGISCFEDHQSRFIIQLYMRTSRKQYLTAKYVAAFVAGGTAVVVPLALNLLCAMTLFPDFIPSPVFSMSKVSEAQSFVNIFYSYPMIYEIYSNNPVFPTACNSCNMYSGRYGRILGYAVGWCVLRDMEYVGSCILYHYRISWNMVCFQT